VTLVAESGAGRRAGGGGRRWGGDVSSAPVVAPSPPPVPPVGVVLPLAGETVDLGARVLVAGVVPPPRFGREAEVAATAAAVAAAGADLVDVPLPARLAGPVAARPGTSVSILATSPDQAATAARIHARVVMVAPDLVAAAVDAVADGGGGRGGSDATAGSRTTVAVLVDDLGAIPAARAAAAAGRLPLAFDATRVSGAEAIARESAAVAEGCRLLRSTDVRRSRRVAEVMSAILGARHPADARPPGASPAVARDLGQVRP
jgi:hypothetical protein